MVNHLEFKCQRHLFFQKSGILPDNKMLLLCMFVILDGIYSNVRTFNPFKGSVIYAWHTRWKVFECKNI